LDALERRGLTAALWFFANDVAKRGQFCLADAIESGHRLTRFSVDY
jgi:hypothetical protein